MEELKRITFGSYKYSVDVFLRPFVKRLCAYHMMEILNVIRIDLMMKTFNSETINHQIKVIIRFAL